LGVQKAAPYGQPKEDPKREEAKAENKGKSEQARQKKKDLKTQKSFTRKYISCGEKTPSRGTGTRRGGGGTGTIGNLQGLLEGKKGYGEKEGVGPKIVREGGGDATGGLVCFGGGLLVTGCFGGYGGSGVFKYW